MYWVVVVDDDNECRNRVEAVLTKKDTKVTKLSSGKELLDYIEGMVPLPDLILMDVVMPEMNGFETIKRLWEGADPKSHVPVIFLTGEEDIRTEIEGLNLGAVDFIRKPFISEILAIRVIRMIEFERLKNDLSREVEKKTQENTRLTLHVVQTLAKAIDAKDTYTNGHSDRVAAYAKEIAKRYGYDEQGQDEIYMMGLLHDVGKIGVPDEIINKTSRLTDEEFAEIKKHPVVGNNILKKIKEMPQLAFGARWHHERVDGRGYPDGLKGNEIPEQARIIAVADAYDAMTSNRSYRQLMPQDKVRAEIEKGKGTQFDRKFAEIMIAIIDDDKDYRLHEGTEEEANPLENASEEAMLHMEKQSVIPYCLLEIDQLNTDLGLYLCGDVEDYLDAVSVFSDSIFTKSEKIENAWKNEDIDTYTTLVHSLKSSARTIGAMNIWEMSRKLESAGKSGDIELIRQETPLLLTEYRSMKNLLKNI